MELAMNDDKKLRKQLNIKESFDFYKRDMKLASDLDKGINKELAGKFIDGEYFTGTQVRHNA